MWCNHNNCLMQFGYINASTMFGDERQSAILENLFSFFYVCEKEVNKTSRNHFQMLSNENCFRHVRWTFPRICIWFVMMTDNTFRAFSTQTQRNQEKLLWILYITHVKNKFFLFSSIFVCFVIAISIWVLW